VRCRVGLSQLEAVAHLGDAFSQLPRFGLALVRQERGFVALHDRNRSPKTQ